MKNVRDIILNGLFKDVERHFNLLERDKDIGTRIDFVRNCRGIFLRLHQSSKTFKRE